MASFFFAGRRGSTPKTAPVRPAGNPVAMKRKNSTFENMVRVAPGIQMPTISMQMPTITPLAVRGQPSESCLPGELVRLTEGCSHHAECQGKLSIPSINLCPFDTVKRPRPVLSPNEASKKLTFWEKGKMFGE